MEAHLSKLGSTRRTSNIDPHDPNEPRTGIIKRVWNDLQGELETVCKLNSVLLNRNPFFCLETPGYLTRSGSTLADSQAHGYQRYWGCTETCEEVVPSLRNLMSYSFIVTQIRKSVGKKLQNEDLKRRAYGLGLRLSINTVTRVISMNNKIESNSEITQQPQEQINT